MAEELTQLSYPGPLVRDGVTIDVDSARLRITLPPSHWRRVIQICLGTLLIVLFFTMPIASISGQPYPHAVGSICIVAFIPILVGLALFRLGKPTVIVVDAETLEVVRPLRPEGMDGNREPYRMPRAAVYRVSYVAASRAILVRGTGQQMIEIACPYRDQVGEEIAATIRRWLPLPDDSPAPPPAAG